MAVQPREWGQYGITVGRSCQVRSRPHTKDREQSEPEQVQFVREQMPLRRTGRPDAGRAALSAFYLSEEAGWTTGAILLGNGGGGMFRVRSSRARCFTYGYWSGLI